MPDGGTSVDGHMLSNFGDMYCEYATFGTFYADTATCKDSLPCFVCPSNLNNSLAKRYGQLILIKIIKYTERGRESFGAV